MKRTYLAVVIAAVGIILALPPSEARAQAKVDPESLVGHRVVTTIMAPIRTFEITLPIRLKLGKIDPSEDFRVYVVDQAKDGLVLIRSEDSEIAGWAPAILFVRVDQAIPAFTAVIERKPTALAYRKRASVFEANEKYDEAIADYDQALKIAPDSSDLRICRGFAWCSKKEWNKAIADFDEAIRIAPKQPLGYSCRGYAYTERKEFDKAIRDYDEAIRLDGSDASLFLSRAQVWSQKEEYDKAIRDYDEAIRLDGTDWTAFDHRGWAWRYKKEYARAIADYDEAVRLAPNKVLALNHRGLTRQDMKEYVRAVEDFAEAIRIDPTDAGSWNNRGIAWYDLKEYDKAIKDFTEAIRLDPDDAYTMRNRGNSFLKAEEYDQAIRDYDEAQRLGLNDAILHNNRGYAWEYKKEYAKAIVEFQEAIRVEPDNDWSHSGIAWLLATCPEDRIRDGKRAVEFATKACELTDWKDADTIDTLAAALAEAGRFDEAVKRQEQAIATLGEPDEESAEDARSYAEHLAAYRMRKPWRDTDD